MGFEELIIVATFFYIYGYTHGYIYWNKKYDYIREKYIQPIIDKLEESK